MINGTKTQMTTLQAHFIQDFLVGYSIITGAVLGVLLSHYYGCANQILSVSDLYSTRGGAYVPPSLSLSPSLSAPLPISPSLSLTRHSKVAAPVCQPAQLLVTGAASWVAGLLLRGQQHVALVDSAHLLT